MYMLRLLGLFLDIRRHARDLVQSLHQINELLIQILLATNKYK